MRTKTLFVWRHGALVLAFAAAACSTAQPSQESIGTATSALGASGLFHTGESDTTTLIDGTTADPHFAVTYSSDPTYSSASLAAPLSAWAVGIQATYVPKDTTNIAQWISVVQTTGKTASGTPYVYTYSLFFQTPSAPDLTLVGLPLTWACDDDCKVFLNHSGGAAVWTSANPLASLTAGYNTKHSTVLNVSGSLATASTQNRLDFCIDNSGGWETGLFVSQLGCSLDADCPGYFCHNPSTFCAQKLPNKTSIPTITGHTPALTGACSDAVGTSVCTSGVCSTVNNQCGYEDGHSCPSGSAQCQSGTCAADICGPSHCTKDSDCITATQFCNLGEQLCANKLDFGQAMPADTGRTPTAFDGKCSSATGATEAPIVCRSAVCDTNDELCGYANGDGTCDSASATTVCRSGACDTDHKCGYLPGDGSCTAGSATVCRSGACTAAGVCGCAADADCDTASQFCAVSAKTCTAKAKNGEKVPTDSGHVTPVLDGTCSTAAATAACLSKVCSTVNDECGYENGHSCAAGAECQSASCGTGKICVGTGGCSADSDCNTATQFCKISTQTCTPKAKNGEKVPTDSGHVTPVLDGTCSTAEAQVGCLSGVCETSDQLCGYKDGDSCAASAECRSATCNAGVCVTPGCTKDSDCDAKTQFCKVATYSCEAKATNGEKVPTDSGHVSPVLDGTCSTAEAQVGCLSGVCETSDQLCGYKDGDSCAASAECRSGTCNAGVCVTPGCTKDSDCDAKTQFCNIGKAQCAAKVDFGEAMPPDTGRTPLPFDGKCSSTSGATEALIVCLAGVCDAADELCGYANGDGPCTKGDATTVCRSKACDPDGKCGYANGDGPCSSTDASAVCRSTHCAAAGTCAAPGCSSDADCNSATEYCSSASRACVSKLPNGEAMPTDPGHSPALTGTCSPAEAAVVCQSGVCDADGRCGYLPGTSPCSGNSVCRNNQCDATTQTCASGCTSDADCPTGDYCGQDKVCAPKKPVAQVCGGHHECQSGLCDGAKCQNIVASGNGVVCSVGRIGDGGNDGKSLVAIVGLALAGVGLRRRRRRR